jgi:hypothetical protein
MGRARKDIQTDYGSRLLALLAARKQRRTAARRAEDALAKARAGFAEREARLGPSWQRRALLRQRALRERYVEKHGPSNGWEDAVRRSFEEELAAEADRARASWEKEAAALRREKRKVLPAARAEAAGRRAALEKTGADLRAAAEEREGLQAKQAAASYDLLIPLFHAHKSGFRQDITYEMGDRFSGRKITPRLRKGFLTTAWILNQGVDTRIRRKEIYGRYKGRGSVECSRSKKEPRPPYTFLLEAELKDGLAVYEYRDLRFHGDPPQPTDLDVGVALVRTVLAGNTYQHGAATRTLDGMWRGYALHPWMEVEGFPIVDRRKFEDLWHEVEVHRAKMNRTDYALKKVGKDFRAGRLPYEQAVAQTDALYAEMRKRIAGSLALLAEFKKINPAFK